MNIQLTPQAEQKLKDKLGDKPGTIRLIYDTEGCGCAVNGVPGLRIVDEPTVDDITVDTGSPVPFIVKRQQEIFFEDKMKLDADPGVYAFRLDSSGQSYGTNIQIIDIRTQNP